MRNGFQGGIQLVVIGWLSHINSNPFSHPNHLKHFATRYLVVSLQVLKRISYYNWHLRRAIQYLFCESQRVVCQYYKQYQHL